MWPKRKRSTVDGLSESELMWRIVRPLWPGLIPLLPGVAWVLASDGQRAMYTLTMFTRAVSNGGLDHFFAGPSGGSAGDILAAFKLLSIDDRAAAMSEAMHLFPNGQVPRDRQQRLRLLHSVPEAQRRRRFAPLEPVLFGEPKLWPHFRRYIESHASDFFD